MRCDNSLVEEILSQVSTSQSSNVAVTNCFLSFTEYRNFTLPFTLITILPLKIRYLNNSITESLITFFLWRSTQKQFKIIVSPLLYAMVWVLWLEFNSSVWEREKENMLASIVYWALNSFISSKEHLSYTIYFLNSCNNIIKYPFKGLFNESLTTQNDRTVWY